MELLIVASVNDLVQCLIGAFVQFELKYEDCPVCADVGVNAPLVSAGFCLDVRAEQEEYDKEYGLVVFTIRASVLCS